MFCRVVLEEEYLPPMHCVTVDLIETEACERGFTAVLRRNIGDFFAVCAAWLERAKAEPDSKEGVLLAKAQRELGKEPEQYRGAQKLLELL